MRYLTLQINGIDYVTERGRLLLGCSKCGRERKLVVPEMYFSSPTNYTCFYCKRKMEAIKKVELYSRWIPFWKEAVHSHSPTCNCIICTSPTNK
jgi:hypothetical protein